MKIIDLVQKPVLTQPVYEPGRPIEEVARELGLNPADIIKLASNENAFGPSPRGIAAARAALESAQLYPDGGAFVLRGKIAGKLGLDPSQIVVGNGSNEVIELLGHAFLGPGDEAGPFVLNVRLKSSASGRASRDVLLEGRRCMRRRYG